MQRFIEQARKIASRYTVGQKVVSVLIILAMAFGIYYLASYIRRPQYRQLYSGLDQKDAAEVAQKLDELKVDYRLEGGSILVPAGEVDRLRVKLAAENIPTGGAVGFEIFDKSDFGTSDFNQRVKYQRALEGELARTIASIDQVQSAVVHIAMPEDGVFASQSQKVSASVLLSLKGSSSLDKSQVEGIRNLVARAVKDLDPQNVSIVDSQGNPLYAGDSGSVQAADRLQTIRNYQTMMESSLQQMLNRVVGEGKGLVKVSLDLDLSTKTIQTEEFDKSAESGLPKSQKTKEENYSSGGGGAEGVPGTGSNIPDYATVTTGEGGGTYTRKESETIYDNNHTITEMTEPPGKITQMSIAVLIDQSVDLGNVSALREAIAEAAGLDEERGDSITVQTVPFSDSFQKEVEAKIAKEQKSERLWKIIKTSLLLLGAVFVTLLLLRKLKSIRKRLESMPELRSGEMNALEEAAAGARALMERQSKTPMLSSLEMLAAQKPDEMARLLKALLHEKG
jgi:flagellar M-ring protein FliF